MCDYDAEYADFWSVQTPRANKVHICCACGERIERGQKYQRIGAKHDGMMSSYKRCVRCAEIADRLYDLLKEPIDIYLDCGADPLKAGEHPNLDELAFWRPGDEVTWVTA